MTTKCEIEAELLAKNLTAPRVTLEAIKNLIVKEDYYVFPNTTLTICVLTLKNGFYVTGESSCVSIDNFDADIGKKIAYDNAVNKIWPLEGYLLREKLSQS